MKKAIGILTILTAVLLLGYWFVTKTINDCNDSQWDGVVTGVFCKEEFVEKIGTVLMIKVGIKPESEEKAGRMKYLVNKAIYTYLKNGGIMVAIGFEIPGGKFVNGRCSNGSISWAPDCFNWPPFESTPGNGWD